jgi:hypothetical protein
MLGHLDIWHLSLRESPFRHLVVAALTHFLPSLDNDDFRSSSLTSNLVAMTSYTLFCFPQHIRNSAFPHVNSTGILPSVSGSLHDTSADMCYLEA